MLCNFYYRNIYLIKNKIMKYILLDTETTWLPTEKINWKTTNTNNRVIQLWYIILEENKKVEIIEEFASLPEWVKINTHAMSIHNITPEKIQNKPLLTETPWYKKLESLNNKKNILVIHNAEFDLEMLRRDWFENQMMLIDTLKVAKHLYPNSESHSLQYLRYYLNLYKTEEAESQKLWVKLLAHNTLWDILFMKMLLSKMTIDIKERFNLNSASESIKKMIDLTSEPVFTKFLKFWKYKWELLKEVFSKDRGYTDWLLNNTEDKDLIYSIELLKKDNEIKFNNKIF